MFKLKLPTRLFFWKKKQKPAEKSQVEKAEEMLQLYLKYVPQLRQIMRESESGNIASVGEQIGRMYDFWATWDQRVSMNRDDFTRFAGPIQIPAAAEESGDMRTVATPVSVMAELKIEPYPLVLEGIDEKIETLRDKTLLVNQRFAQDQIKGLIKRLENRKKYQEQVQFFTSFPDTSDEKIDALLAKYKLEMNTSDLFVPTFPKEAVAVMKEYTKVTKALTGETPVYYVIAEPADFLEKAKKLDPILLVQSPFGFYWQILGAWDKEMLLLSEL